MGITNGVTLPAFSARHAALPLCHLLTVRCAQFGVSRHVPPRSRARQPHTGLAAAEIVDMLRLSCRRNATSSARTPSSDWTRRALSTSSGPNKRSRLRLRVQSLCAVVDGSWGAIAVVGKPPDRSKLAGERALRKNCGRLGTRFKFHRNISHVVQNLVSV